MKDYSQLRGDGGSRVIEQIQAQQAEYARQFSDVRHVVGVGSGKGGVGKSTLTLLLALAFRRLGYKNIGILDADLNGPSLARLSGIQNTVLVPGEHGLEMPCTEDGIGVVSFGSFLDESEALEFESVSSSDSYTWRATKEFTTLGQVLRGVHWGTLDVLFVDLPPGPERTYHFAEYFGEDLSLVLVTNPTELSHEVVSRAVSAAQNSKSSILGYIENMKGYYCSKCDEIRPLFSVDTDREKSGLAVPQFGEVAFDPRLASLCDSGMLLGDCVPFPFFEQVLVIAEKLNQQLESADEVSLCGM